MGRILWNIWDAASYDVVELLIKDGSLPALNKILECGSRHPVQLNEYNSQTPCALAMQFTGKDSETLEVGGYNTPDYKSTDNVLDYYPTFANKSVGDEVAWNKKYIGKKRVALSQIPYSKKDTNCIYSINGFSKKKASYTYLVEKDFDKNGIKRCSISDKIYEVKLLKSNDKAIIQIDDFGGCISEIECDNNSNNDIWIDEKSGFKAFCFKDEDDKIIVLLTDVWEYTLTNIDITEEFREAIGPFMGVSYGRLYRNGKFGKPYYSGGSGRAEDILYLLMEQMARCFTKMNLWLMENIECDALISYQPCVDEASHEFYGWWKNSVGLQKEFYWNLIKKAYYLADCHLSSVIQKMNETDRIMVTSDHGIYAVKYNFYINEYLEREELLVTKNEKIDVNSSKIFFHPAETGALYLGGASVSVKPMINALLKLEICGHKVIKSVEKPKSRVMGDYFIVPEDNINIKADFSGKLLEKTNKTGCHTVNTNISSMRAICFLTDNVEKKGYSSGEEISYKKISDIFINNIKIEGYKNEKNSILW